MGAEYISIDDFIEKEGIEHVNILHADVQGGEYEMLISSMKHLDQSLFYHFDTPS